MNQNPGSNRCLRSQKLFWDTWCNDKRSKQFLRRRVFLTEQESLESGNELVLRHESVPIRVYPGKYLPGVDFLHVDALEKQHEFLQTDRPVFVRVQGAEHQNADLFEVLLPHFCTKLRVHHQRYSSLVKEIEMIELVLK